MKKNIIFSFIAFVTFIGCLGFDSKTEIKNNPILGTYPYIAYSFPNMEEALESQKDEELSKAKDQSVRGKIVDKYHKKVDELEAKKKKLLEEARQVRGNAVPFEQEPDGLFEVISAEVAGVYEDGNKINLNFKIKSLTAGNANIHQRMYCLYFDSQEKVIGKGRITPFFDSIDKAYGVYNKPYKEGEILVKDGSQLTLQCKFTDFTDFAKVKFVSKEVYDETGK